MNQGLIGFPAPLGVPAAGFLTNSVPGSYLYTVPENVFNILVACVGGAGGAGYSTGGKDPPRYGSAGGPSSFGTFLTATGGGYGASTTGGNKLGGNGGFSLGLFKVTPGAVIPYTVGAAGIGNNTTGNGGNSPGANGVGVGGNISNGNVIDATILFIGTRGSASLTGGGATIVMPWGGGGS